jgi:molecular chaperone GrpE
MQKGQRKSNSTVPQPSLASRKGKIAEVEDLKSVLHEKEQLHARTVAEFDNYRKRVAQEGDLSSKAAIRQLLLELVSVQDSFDRAFQSEALKAEPQVYQGMRSIQRQIHQMLEQRNVMSFESIGQMFNPSLHEAVDTERSQKFADGFISREIEKGYVWEEKVLRPAKVIVVKNGSPSARIEL